MKKITVITTLLAAAMSIHVESSAQGFLKKIKDKASEVANKTIDRKVDKAVGLDTETTTIVLQSLLPRRPQKVLQGLHPGLHAAENRQTKPEKD
jgi:hypothetical protein